VTIYNPCSRLLWSLTTAGPSTTLTAPGNSGTWQGVPSSQTPVDLRDVTDVWLSVYGGTAAGGAPSLVAALNVYDDQGNLFGPLLTTTAITTSATGKWASGGMHGVSTANFVLPMWGQVAWTAGTGSFTGAEIALFGR
jgi:hypothetical protein